MSEPLMRDERCGWFGEGRGQCVLRADHPRDHVCEEDARIARERDQRIQDETRKFLCGNCGHDGCPDCDPRLAP